jgi:hypothetical protein
MNRIPDSTVVTKNRPRRRCVIMRGAAASANGFMTTPVVIASAEASGRSFSIATTAAIISAATRAFVCAPESCVRKGQSSISPANTWPAVSGTTTRRERAKTQAEALFQSRSDGSGGSAANGQNARANVGLYLKRSK